MTPLPSPTSPLSHLTFFIRHRNKRLQKPRCCNPRRLYQTTVHGTKWGNKIEKSAHTGRGECCGRAGAYPLGPERMQRSTSAHESTETQSLRGERREEESATYSEQHIITCTLARPLNLESIPRYDVQEKTKTGSKNSFLKKKQ